MSRNPKLRDLGVGWNRLTDIDVSQNPELETLGLSENKLERIDLRGVRSGTINSLEIGACSGDKNPLTELKIHESIKGHSKIREAKTACGDQLTIKVYSADPDSTNYMLVDGDWLSTP